MIINPIRPVYFVRKYPQKINLKTDFCTIENSCINKKPLVERKIIDNNQSINSFFNNIASLVFADTNDREQFSALLKKGFVTLSSSCYMDLKNPESAYGVVLERNRVDLESFDAYINKGQGIGVNFSQFSNPTDEIIKLNKYFKQKEPLSIRPPAGIALLDINHKKIKEFIELKNNANYNDWCFDLSVIIDDNFFNNPDNKLYAALLNSMLKKGEPGVIFSNNKNYICDCCAACELKPNEGLTLAHINLSKFYNYKTNNVDYNYLYTVSRLLKKAMDNIDKNAYIGVLGYQDLLDKLNYDYGSKEALGVLENCLKTIKKTNCKTALSPNGTTSRILGVYPSIEPKEKNIDKELITLQTAKKYMDGQISKTIILKRNATIEDVDRIIKTAKKIGLSGISVFRDEKNI